MLKGTERLNKTISSELAQFGISRCVLGSEYSYSYVDNDIMYKLELTLEDEFFSEFLKDRFDFDDEGLEFIFSLLHEVGHSIANEEIDGMIYDFCESEKERINRAMQTAETVEECKKLEFQYFNLPDEIMATQWAVNYMKTHKLEIDIMWAVMREAILKFYELNGLYQDTED